MDDDLAVHDLGHPGLAPVEQVDGGVDRRTGVGVAGLDLVPPPPQFLDPGTEVGHGQAPYRPGGSRPARRAPTAGTVPAHGGWREDTVLPNVGDGRALVGVVTGASDTGATRVGLLGPLAISVGDAEVVVAGFRRRALVARLAMGNGAVVAADRLADDLWEDDPGRRSVPTLRTYVAKLRHILPGGAATLASAPGGYLLALGPDALDVARFERAMAAATGSPADVERALLPAVAEWRGGAYEEFAHLPWARQEATRLDELRLAAQERLFDAQLALGRHSDLVAALGALAAAHPLRERLQVQLVTALYRDGRQAEALAAQRRATAALVDQLGLRPSAGARGAGRAHPPAGPDPRRPRGRPVPDARERARPRPAAADAPTPPRAALRRPHPGTGLPGGGPGHGRRRRRPARCGPRGAGDRQVPPGRRVRRAGPRRGRQRALRAMRRRGRRALPAVRRSPARAGLACPRDILASRLGDDPGALAALAPELAAHLLDQAPLADGNPAGLRLRLFDAVAGWLRATARSGPTVVVLEDLHWATASTVMLTRHVVRALGDQPVLLVATARSTAPDASALAADLVADLHQDGRVEVIDLAGLTPDAVDALIAAERGVGPGPHEPLHAATAGNPFLLLALARHGLGETVPPSIRDVLRARTERLPGAVRDALQVGAVAGVEFDLRSVAATLGWDDEDTVTALDAAVAAGLLHEADETGGRYAFVHQIVQVAVAEAQGPTRRAAIHAAVARARA